MSGNEDKKTSPHGEEISESEKSAPCAGADDAAPCVVSDPAAENKDVYKNENKTSSSGPRARRKAGTVLTWAAVLVVVPALLFIGVFLWHESRYALVTVLVAAAACVPFFVSFEKCAASTEKLIVMAVMTALSCVGRIVFEPVPGFKPVTAIVVITALYLGPGAGFMTGALSAVLSNFFFGQGPWTPFQMFVWGLLGFIAGLLNKPLKKSLPLLCVYGALSGAVYSLMMDVWTVLWAQGSFDAAAYKAAITTALPFTAAYAASNVVFLLLLARPIGRKLTRLEVKYGIGGESGE